MLFIHLFSAGCAVLSTAYMLTTRAQQYHITTRAYVVALGLLLSVLTGILLSLERGVALQSVCANIVYHELYFTGAFLALAYQSRAFKTISTHALWSLSYTTVVPVTLLVLGF